MPHEFDYSLHAETKVIICWQFLNFREKNLNPLSLRYKASLIRADNIAIAQLQWSLKFSKERMEIDKHCSKTILKKKKKIP